MSEKALAVRDTDVDVEQVAQVKDAILGEQVQNAEQLAQVLGVSIIRAKEILASDETQTQIMQTFRKSALAELDLYEIPMYMKVLRTRRDTVRGRAEKKNAARRLRKILETKESGKPLVQINQNVISAGAIENLLSKLPPR